MSGPSKKVLSAGHDGMMVIGECIADTVSRVYYPEGAAEA